MADIEGLQPAAGSRFSQVELIGRGAFGDVYKVFDKELKKEVAIKEISVLSQCRCQYITEYYGSYLHQTKLWLIMEYMAGGSVADLLQSGPPLDEMSIASISRKDSQRYQRPFDFLMLFVPSNLLCSLLETFLLSLLAAASILLTENGDVKVADFGVSAQLTRTISQRKTFVGTPFWMAPEVIQNSDGYNEKLDEHFSRPMKEFASLCLKKVPAERATAKELLKHRFIKNARKSQKLLERIRERPKYQLKEDAETPRNGPKPVGESTDIVKVTRDVRGEETVRASNQGKTFRSAGWDFSIGGQQNTVSSGKGTRELYSNENQDNYHDDETSVGGSGTVVRRSPRGCQSSGLIRDPSSLSSSEHASFEDASTSGTIVFCGQHDDSDSPPTPRSRLGIQGRPSAASVEDAGLRKGNARDRSALSENNGTGNENRRRDLMSNSSNSSRSSHEYFDAQKAFPRTCQPSDDEENAKITSSCIPLSMLLIPSLKEVIADDSEGRVMRVVTNSLVHMERTKPGSCEALVCKLLDRLASSKEPSMKGLQDVAARMFNKGKVTPEDVQNSSPETDGKKRLQHKELHSNSNLSPLARFLVSRWQSQTSLDLSRVKMKTVRSIIHLCSICSDFDVHNIASNCRIFDIIDV
ncbi:hypothetical protein ES332_D13G184500v1 [Gossypium tomentosum]|uniref:non-specific serine/threonine protein kinase n=1 Tax=Gossypium tomentosum TaxID=34277 RepID=A0A5D2HYV5_GOSTO|nr:hypothetical protein ES332_D13G184500v1 [Gossypium tomentosum]